jgi:hypothetical protein
VTDPSLQSFEFPPAGQTAPEELTVVPDTPVVVTPKPASEAPVWTEEPPPRQADGMAQTALVFLENPLARRLAIAWGSCHGDEKQWHDAAGVTISEQSQAQRLGRALRINGVCRDGGVTDQLALQYITALVAAPLRKGKRHDRTK